MTLSNFVTFMLSSEGREEVNWVKGQEELGGRAFQGGVREYAKGPRKERTPCGPKVSQPTVPGIQRIRRRELGSGLC